MKTKRKLIVKCRKRIQLKHTSNPFCLFQMSAVTNMQCNYTNLNGISSLNNHLITVVFLRRHNSPPSGPGRPQFRIFTITHRHTTHFRTHLGEWSARNRDLCLIIDRHPRPQAGFEPATLTSERPQTHDLDRVATGIGNWKYLLSQICLESTKICRSSDS